MVPSTRTSDIVVIREMAAGVEHQFQVTASLEVQGEMYESGKSIPRKIVIGKGYINFALLCVYSISPEKYLAIALTFKQETSLQMKQHFICKWDQCHLVQLGV